MYMGKHRNGAKLNSQNFLFPRVMTLFDSAPHVMLSCSVEQNTHLYSFCPWSKVYCHHSTFPDKPPCGCHGFSIRRCVLHSSLLSSTRYYRSVPIDPLGSVLKSSMSSMSLLPEWVSRVVTGPKFTREVTTPKGQSQLGS